jgi:hypothetical protein
VANRLSKHSKVLLLEAGGDPVYHVSVPFMSYEMMHLPEYNWGHKSVTQKHSSLSMIDQVQLIKEGILLRGHSHSNFHNMHIYRNPDGPVVEPLVEQATLITCCMFEVIRWITRNGQI